MNRTVRRASLLGLALVAVQLVAVELVVVRPAAAQPAEAAAEREFRLGFVALQKGDCTRALVHYRRSLELAKRPRTVFNIATCEEDLGQDAAAWRDYHAFLNLAEERDAALVVDAKARLDGLRKRLRGQISVESSVSGAAVTVDGERQPRGETPVTLSLEPGRHVLRVSLPGAVAVERIVEIAPDDQTSLRVELALSSSISIQADPADAIIDPRRGGATAVGRLDVPVKPGRHEFVIRRDGYRTEHVSVDAVAGRTHDVRVNLKPVQGVARLVVTGAPAATITVDGTPATSAGAVDLHGLAAGGHEIAIENGGRIVWRRDLHFSPGEVVRLDVDLPPPRSITRRAIGWSAGGLGVASIVAGGILGTFALRDVTSSDLDLHDRGKTRALAADGLIIVGAGALVVAWRLLRSEGVSARVQREARAP
ncbi:MAG: PEGA domain-containing protein [Myxococcales bacterium]|nr:PEGA domain-containing protein [Myxococcales bacterium]